MKKEMTSRQKQALQTKKRIYNKSMELFSETDYEEIPITQICSSLGISVGNFYNYFSSKEELIMESYPDFDKYVNQYIEKGDYNSNVEAIKHLIFKQTQGASLVGPKLYAQMLRIQIKNEGKHVIESTRNFHISLKSLVQAALDSGEIISDYSAENISSLLLRLSRGILLDWAMQNGKYDVVECALFQVDMVLTSMKKG